MQGSELTGTWRNENNSEMTLHVDADGALNGTYRTAVGRPEASESFRLTGFAAGALVTFCVHFGPHGSLTSWTGRCEVDDSGEAVIHTLWHLARETSEAGPTALWESILAGASRFRRSGP